MGIPENLVHIVEKGENCYYCTRCHRASGDGDGLVGKKCLGEGPQKATTNSSNIIAPDSLIGPDVRHFNNHAYIWIVRGQFGILRARLLNLVETSAIGEVQAKAMKGLVKDFCNAAYYEILHELVPYLEEFNVLDKNTAGDPLPSIEDREIKVD